MDFILKFCSFGFCIIVSIQSFVSSSKATVLVLLIGVVH